MIFIKYMIILIPGGAETPLRLSVPPINTKFISSPEHWNTSTYLNIRFKYMGLMNHHWWLIINEYPMYFSLTVCKPAILFQATSDNQATDNWSAPAPNTLAYGQKWPISIGQKWPKWFLAPLLPFAHVLLMAAAFWLVESGAGCPLGRHHLDKCITRWTTLKMKN